MAAPQPPSSPRRSRGFSVKSEQSHRSSISGHKSHLSESSEEKAKRNLHTKADPLIAMNEAQPMAVALEKSNLGSLREMEHKDQYGNVITDPDLSNPTRPRMERPLDTIRSFEAAIYGTYNNNRPISYARTGTDHPAPLQDLPADSTSSDDASQVGDYSRRTSYYGGPNAYVNRFSDQNGYYGSRFNQSRPDSFVDAYQGSSQVPENYYPYNQHGRGRSRHYSRVSTDQGIYGGTPSHNYPPQTYQRSYDNVTAMSGSGSGYTDPYGQSTDPSSLNSSMDQLQQQALQQQRLDERAQAEYSYQGFSMSPNTNSKALPPAPAPVADPNWGGPVGGVHAAAGAKPSHLRKNTNRSNGNEKRKSWFKRRFSKG
ncbi:Protein of unknown function DUF2406 [Penicillium alfredii]|uniref:DUF2406 domain-containing protein n=1 Tax=Penicillium alfredii TaxID=1506179 RepID=A0A9W9GBB5_9EURO|nr:Protein of unknown function DUF2406 [Penicillium alfredii]KAJ5114967.1 Protein of unknown function DUF2406 [Penicillium alfredii]